ncbi:MAG: zinc carboxypeptidase [Deltaproteobacteria bacterium]|nr:MAG: zinc carboxypeptidase [Deltaproteobacteria bacterium]
MKALVLILTLLSSTAFASGTWTYWVHLKAKDSKTRSEISKFIHIDQVIDDSVYAVVNEHDYKELKKNFSKLLVDHHPYKEILPTTDMDEFEFPSGDEKFHTYQEIIDKIKELTRTYPNLTEELTIGNSLEGRNLIGIKISGAKNPNNKFFIPGIAFLGAHHAREHLSVEVPIMLASYLLENYNKDARIKNLVDNREIFIVPMVNPDGAMYDIKGKKYKSWRKNRAQNRNGTSGVDLNRNYSFGWGTGGSSTSPGSDVFMGPKPFSEPETLAVKEFVEAHANIRVLLSFHTFSELILYPWGGKYDGVGGKDQQVFEKMAQTMSKWNRYKPQQASDLYIASGDTCDWAYGTQNIFCFTFELSPKSMWNGGFYPGAKVIDKTFQANVNPALYLIEHAADPYAVLNN